MCCSPLEIGLVQNTVEGPGRKIIAGLARNGDPAGFRRMLELAMASLRSDEIPAILTE